MWPHQSLQRRPSPPGAPPGETLHPYHCRSDAMRTFTELIWHARRHVWNCRAPPTPGRLPPHRA
eukprot:14871544-Alexandrium_andersonii.AAC.1